jgi:flavoprotein
MHYWPMKEMIRCSECGCDRSETVEQGSVRFIRCRGCGREGCRYQILCPKVRVSRPPETRKSLRASGLMG